MTALAFRPSAGPLSLDRMRAVPLRAAQFAGLGRTVLDLGCEARVYICDATSAVALDVMLEEWGSAGTGVSPTPGERITSCPEALRFAQDACDLRPMVCFLVRHAGLLRLTLAGCTDPSRTRLYLWPDDYSPRRMAGPGAFSQSGLLARRMSEGFVPPAPLPPEELLSSLVG